MLIVIMKHQVILKIMFLKVLWISNEQRPLAVSLLALPFLPETLFLTRKPKKSNVQFYDFWHRVTWRGNPSHNISIKTFSYQSLDTSHSKRAKLPCLHPIMQRAYSTRNAI